MPIAKKAIRRKPTRRRTKEPSDRIFGRQKSVKNLKAILDQAFSKYVRLRDSDEKGRCKCITCNNVEHWKFMDNGHWVRRKHMATRYHPQNNHAQCKTCNQVMNPEEMEVLYAASIEAKYGKGTAANLVTLKHTTKRYTVPELMELIDWCNTEVARMLKEKGL